MWTNVGKNKIVWKTSAFHLFNPVLNHLNALLSQISKCRKMRVFWRNLFASKTVVAELFDKYYVWVVTVFTREWGEPKLWKLENNSKLYFYNEMIYTGLAKLVCPVISFFVRAVKSPQCQTGIQVSCPMNPSQLSFCQTFIKSTK